MIPKIIHYVWLSKEQKPKHIQHCINSWSKIMPDYCIQPWSMDDFDFKTMPAYVQEALDAHKWAMVTDYLRLYILYRHGGIYLDSDVLALKPFDELLESSGFTFIERHKDKDSNKEIIQIQAACIGASSGNDVLKIIMQYYEDQHFKRDDGQLALDCIAPDIYAGCIKDLGFDYKDKMQYLPCDFVVYPSIYLAAGYKQRCDSNYAIHLGASSWHDYSFEIALKNKIKWFLVKNK